MKMMKQTVAVLCIVAVLATMAGVNPLALGEVKAAETNLITNGTMEEASGWTATSVNAANGSGEVTYDADGGYDGQALKYTYTDNADSTSTSSPSIRMSDNKVAVEPNTTYIYSAWLKTSENTRVQLYGISYNESGSEAGRHAGEEVVQYNREWNLYTLEFTTSADATTLLPQINLNQLGSTRSIWIDDVSLIKKAEPNVLGLITNGDMEVDGYWVDYNQKGALKFVEGGQSGNALQVTSSAESSAQVTIQLEPEQRFVEVEPNTTYTLSVRVKVMDAGCYLDLYAYPYASESTRIEGGEVHIGSTVYNAIAAWQELTIDITTPDQTTLLVPRLTWTNGDTTRYILIDNFSLTEKPKEPIITELVSNGDMSLSSGWTSTSVNATNGSGEVTYDVEGGYDGQALKYTYTDNADSTVSTSPGIRMSDNKVEVEPNTTYIFSAWLKTSENTRIQLQGISYNESGSEAGRHTGENVIKYNRDWNLYTLEFTTGGDATTLLPQINLNQLSSTRSIWIDDVSLKIASSGEMVLNGSFTTADSTTTSGYAYWKMVGTNAAVNVSAVNGISGVDFKGNGCYLQTIPTKSTIAGSTYFLTMDTALSGSGSVKASVLDQYGAKVKEYTLESAEAVTSQKFLIPAEYEERYTIRIQMTDETGDTTLSLGNVSMEMNRGDFDGDGTVEEDDIAMMRKALVNHDDATEYLPYIDLTADEEGTVTDLVRIKLYAAGLK